MNKEIRGYWLNYWIVKQSKKGKLMEEVKCFKTKDGRIFNQEDEAEQHSRFLEFHEFYIKDPLLDIRGNSVPSEDVFAFMVRTIPFMRDVFPDDGGLPIPAVEKTVNLSDVILMKYSVMFEGKLCTLSLTNRGTVKINPIK